MNDVATSRRAAPPRATYWWWGALLLNAALLVYSLGLASYSFGVSLFFALTALAGLVVIFWARFANEYVLYPLHVGSMLILLLGAYASYTNIWVEYAWLDLVLHFFGGLFVALYALSLTHHRITDCYCWLGNRKNSAARISDFWAIVLWGVSIAVLVGVLWEFAEYGIHILFENPSYVLSATDLLSDLLADMLGALVASLPFAWLVRPPRR